MNECIFAGMNISELHKKIIAAYSDQNLHNITITLIHLYRMEQFGTLEHITGMIGESVNITIDPELKYFSKLMMLYHPDRGPYHRMEINRLSSQNDYDGLMNYKHILLLDRIEEMAKTLSCMEDIDYSPVYEWDLNADGFHIVDYDTSATFREEKDFTAHCNSGVNFYEAFQLRMFGSTTTDFPVYYLEDIEEFELAQSGIDDLSGIQYCIHARTMDLSGNAISDISYIWELSMLEDLNLSDNRLEMIDGLSNLQNLRSINLSDNDITDVSPLMRLNKLEYAELSGNRITRKQIRSLEALGITVVSD
ncbi:MAG: leucine-rich repeat domain-containing protein [Bacteroidales bacterium]|nr:leucine-rich repeat domain-containing protein [Bacteroidales bacterium]